MKSFFRFCLVENVDPHLARIEAQFDPHRAMLRHAQNVLMGWAVYLVEVQKVRVGTAQQYVSDLCTMTRKTTTVDLKELVMKDLTDLFRRLHSKYPSEKRSRLGLMQGELRALRTLLCKSGTRVALRFWAFLMTAWQTVSRFDDLVHVRRADVTVQKDRVIIKFRKHKMKGRQGGTVFDTKVIYLPAPSAPPVELCAGSALQEYLKADPLVAGEDPASTPLFQTGGGNLSLTGSNSGNYGASSSLQAGTGWSTVCTVLVSVVRRAP